MVVEGEMKFFVTKPNGKQYTMLEETSGKALNVATNKFRGTPNRRRMFKGARAVWETMKAKGFTLHQRFPL